MVLLEVDEPDDQRSDNALDGYLVEKWYQAWHDEDRLAVSRIKNPPRFLHQSFLRLAPWRHRLPLLRLILVLLNLRQRCATRSIVFILSHTFNMLNGCLKR